MRCLPLSCLLLAWTGAAWAGHGLFDASQPTQQVLRVTADGVWELHQQIREVCCIPEEVAVKVKVPYTVTKEVQENGQTVQKSVTEFKEEVRTQTRVKTNMVCRQVGTQIEPKSVQAFEVDGRPIKSDDLQKRLRGDTLVLVTMSCDGGGTLPDYYASVFKPGTIVISQFQVAGDVPGAPATLGPNQAATAPRTGPRQAAPSSIPVHLAAYQPVDAPAGPLNAPRFPPTPAPTLVFAARDGADAVKIRRFSETHLPVELMLRDNDSSVSPQRPLTALTTFRHSATASLPWSAVRISTPESRDVPADRVKERLGSGEQTVLLSGDGQLVDQFWLQNFKPGVLVFRGFSFSPMESGYSAEPAPQPPVEAAPPPPPGAAVPALPRKAT